jgi:hypothetical protein
MPHKVEVINLNPHSFFPCVDMSKNNNNNNYYYYYYLTKFIGDLLVCIGKWATQNLCSQIAAHLDSKLLRDFNRCFILNFSLKLPRDITKKIGPVIFINWCNSKEL